MGLYFVAFDNQPPLTPDQIKELQKGGELIETRPPDVAPKATIAPKKNEYDSRFDDQVHIEDPNPVLGDKYDSPLDAIPGRLPPAENEKLRAQKAESDNAQRILDEATAKAEKEKSDKEKVDKSGKEKLTEATTKEDEPKATPTQDKSKEDKPDAAKAKNEKAKQDTSKQEKAKEAKAKQDKAKPEKSKVDDSKAKKPEANKSVEAEPNETPKEGKAKSEKPKPENSEKDEGKGGKLKDDEFDDDKPKDDNFEEEKPKGESLTKGSKEKSLANLPKIDEDLDDGNGGKGPVDEKARFQGPPVPEEDYVALCLAVKDQAIDLPEFFIHHYHHLGIRRFYIMDDRSEVPLSSQLDDWGIPEEHITFVPQEPYERVSGHHEQILIYQRCFNNFSPMHTWMVFIDVDEFIEMTAGNETLQDMLHEFEEHKNVGALAINWRMHTSSGLAKRPKSARKAFVDCIWDDDEKDGLASNNTHVKSIVRTSRGTKPKGPHLWHLSGDAVTVGENYDIVETLAWRLPITRNRIGLHHYAGKSREEYEEKMLRGNAMDDPKGEAFWNSLEHGLPLVSCPEMAKYDP